MRIGWPPPGNYPTSTKHADAIEEKNSPITHNAVGLYLNGIRERNPPLKGEADNAITIMRSQL